MMLKSLTIKNFRMLGDFEVAKLGRVNLIVGKNNSGKSTVLEPLRIYASNARPGVLARIARSHNERTPGLASEADGPLPYEAFFSGRRFSPDGDNTIFIGQGSSDPDALRIRYGFSVEREEVVTIDGEVDKRIRTHFIAHRRDLQEEDEPVPCLRITRRNHGYRIRLMDAHPNFIASPFRAHDLRCSHIPTQFVSLNELADEWDRIALTADQAIIIEALQIITPEFEGITFVKDTNASGARELQRTARVKLAKFDHPVPLNSLGDGIVRVFQLILKLFAARGGFFLIDEFGNGLHYSVQERVWSLLFRMAAALDIQVFATTHSWDCIESFARVAKADIETEGLLFRVGQSVRTSELGRTIATVFDREQLHNITQTDVEVR